MQNKKTPYNKISKRITSITIIAAMMITSLAGNAFAATQSGNTQKEEVVYANLDGSGKVKDVHVVNIFEPKDGQITDYGSYTDVRNMTTTDEIKNDGEKIQITTGADKLYYEGTMDITELPWKIDVDYRLDGEKISPEELAGKSGHLAILLSIEKNPEYDKITKGGSSEDFYKNYGIQAAVTLDANKCKNIASEDATFANVGSDKQLTFTMLPDKGGRVRIDADVSDFEMDGIAINVVNLNLNIDVSTDKFDEDTADLKDGAVELDDGVQELKDTVDKDLVDAVQKLKDAVVDLQDASVQMKDGTSDLKDGVETLSDGVNQLYEGSVDLEAGLKTLDASSGQIVSGVDSAVDGALQLAQGASQLAQGYAGSNDTVSGQFGYIAAQLNDLYAGLARLSAVLDMYTDGVSDAASGASSLRGGNKTMLDNMYPLYDGVDEFDSKIGELQDGIDDLSEGVTDLDEGVGDLRDGIQELKDGTGELRDSTDDIDTTIDEKVDEMIDEIKGDGKVVSFVSKKNSNITSVQFVIKTDKIELPEEEEIEIPAAKEMNFWEKLLSLFGFIEAQAATIRDEDKDYNVYNCWWQTEGDVVKACWDKPDYGNKYRVTLYYGAVTDKNILVQATVTGDTYKDFAKDIAAKGPGTYYFRIYPDKLKRKDAIYSEELLVDYAIYKEISKTYGVAERYQTEDTAKKERMPMPQNFIISGDGKLKWDKVDNCPGYQIIIFADDEVVVYKKQSGTSYDIEDYLDDEEYNSVSIRVCAMPTDPINYRRSGYYEIEDLAEFAEDYQLDEDGKWVKLEKIE